MRKVTHTTVSDLNEIFAFFDASIKYQEANGYPAWKNYDQQAIRNDIVNKNQYKILIDEKMAMVFSVCYSDKIIWRHRDSGNSLYLHRIVVNPEFKGQNLFALVLDWSIAHARSRGLKNVRMDTWAANANIISYYQRYGFSCIENYTTPDTAELPEHNRSLALTLLEYQI